MYIDLEKAIREKTISKTEQSIKLYAIGGFPIKEIDNKFYWVNNELNNEFISNNLFEALGLSGMLTYMNKSNLSLKDMGVKLLELEHKWGLHWISLSFLFINYSDKVEKSFLRDSNFYESWVIGGSNIFGFSGSIKSFIKYSNNRNDTSFDLDTRTALQHLYFKLEDIWNTN
jgi:hypothetical protein